MIDACSITMYIVLFTLENISFFVPTTFDTQIKASKIKTFIRYGLNNTLCIQVKWNDLAIEKWLKGLSRYPALTIAAYIFHK